MVFSRFGSGRQSWQLQASKASFRAAIFFGIFFSFFLGIFSRFLGFDGFDWYLQRFAAKLSDLHGVVVVVVGWMDGWMVGWLVRFRLCSCLHL